jgi:polyisoprenoid-binding protein YceI
MAKWEFEPGHTAAEFKARHMMVTWVRGLFKDVHGAVDIDFENPTNSSFEAVIDATRLWTGEPERDAHLRSADFFDVKHYPWITFKSTGVEQVGSVLYKVTGNLTIRGVTRPVTLDVQYLGQWETPYWVDGVNRGVMHRVGFSGKTRINRHDFGVSWNDQLNRGGVVVSDEVFVSLDVEAILAEDLAQA